MAGGNDPNGYRPRGGEIVPRTLRLGATSLGWVSASLTQAGPAAGVPPPDIYLSGIRHRPSPLPNRAEASHRGEQQDTQLRDIEAVEDEDDATTSHRQLCSQCPAAVFTPPPATTVLR